VLLASVALVAVGAAFDEAVLVSVVASAIAIAFVALAAVESGAACGVVASALERTTEGLSEISVSSGNGSPASRRRTGRRSRAVPSDTGR